MEEEPSFSGNVTFSHKTWWEHLRDFVKSPVPILGVAVGVFGALWTFGEAAIQFVGADPRGWFSYVLLMIGSFVASLVWNGYRYYHCVPDGFENVSRKAARIAHWQHLLWEFELANLLLAEKLGPYDRELRDMNTRRSFILSEKPESLQAYIRWIERRPSNLLNMLAVAKQILLKDFPEALFSIRGKPAQPLAILQAVETLARFYCSTVEFERSAHSVMPSESLQKLHELQLGWSEPIRDGVHQLFRFLQELSECDPKGDNQVSFNITFPDAPRQEEFFEELARLEPLIPQLGEDW